ncbi:MAG: S-methyl-5-thioribose-1-phosphate isomerase [Myxococcales bacterium]|nr:S-methyl-5-thioribose-1-phosphate isomerase [Myxococcales bacterium]MBL0197807.1 S-methyl-5-thioribose-1-phosphate isomerase [Myxococcales bacterium]HQY60338.1 S-methyl-5-thioribose-1-phosphate isomerase [Polyangiaceae bacterium]
MSAAEPFAAIRFPTSGWRALVLDQRRLPWAEIVDEVTTWEAMALAIGDMRVRGAPAIGVAAAYGMALAAHSAPPATSAFITHMERAAAGLTATRPTAVNLAWAAGACLSHARSVAPLGPDERAESCLAFARALHEADVASCRRIGELGAALLPDEGTVLTHCNAGALATGGYGTALGLLRAARAMGKRHRVLASETRPYLQGARLTAWELSRDGFDVSIVCDNMIGHLLAKGQIACAVVGADRVARNGDVANKIGTYGLACLARLHDVPLYVAAPLSTVDRDVSDGDAIPIEQRSAREVVELDLPGGSVRIAPDGVGALHPAFDVTPARLVTALVTERGVASPLNDASLAALFGG